MSPLAASDTRWLCYGAIGLALIIALMREVKRS